MNSRNLGLSPPELKVYLELSLKFQKIIDDAPNFQMGSYQWNQILHDLLQRYALTNEAWVRISEVGDNSDEIQAKLAELIEESKGK